MTKKEVDEICKLVSKAHGKATGDEFRDKTYPDVFIPFPARVIANVVCDDYTARKHKDAFIWEEEIRRRSTMKLENMFKWTSYIGKAKRVLTIKEKEGSNDAHLKKVQMSNLTWKRRLLFCARNSVLQKAGLHFWKNELSKSAVIKFSVYGWNWLRAFQIVHKIIDRNCFFIETIMFSHSSSNFNRLAPTIVVNTSCAAISIQLYLLSTSAGLLFHQRADVRK